MPVTTEDIKKIALLARLKLDEEAIASTTEALSKIISLVETINGENTEGIAPLSHPLDLQLRLREDEVTEHPDREKLQANAPKTASGLYLVPAVIE